MFVPVLLSMLAMFPTPRAPGFGDEPPPRIAGDWKIDPNLSESFQDKMRNRGRFAGPGMGGFGGRPPGGVGGFGGRGGGRGGPPRENGGEGGTGDRMGLADVMRPPVQLSIQQTDSTVLMAVDLGAPRALYLDGRTAVDTLGDMSVRKSKARVRKGRFEVERRVGEFSQLTERYWFDADHNVLVVDVTIEGPMGKVDVRRIYQPVKPTS